MATISRSGRTILSRWWWTIDRPIFFSLMMIMAMGGIMVYAASPSVALRIGLDQYHFVYRQLFFLFLATVICILVSMIDRVAIRRVAVIGLALSILMLILVPFMASEIKGSQRWINIAGINIQPSEFMKPFFAVTAAWFFTRKHLDSGFPGYKICLGLYVVIVVLLALQPDVGMIISLTAIWGAQFFVAGMPLYFLFILAFLAMGGIYGAYIIFPHVSKRINTFLNPEAGDTYQVERSMEAFSRGGFFGAGPGEGTVKKVLPDSHTDFVFAVVAEEFGVVMCTLIIVLFGIIVIRSMIKASQNSDLFSMIAVCGLATHIGIQAIINMGVSLNMLPTKGMTLPFLSYGGSSSVALALGMGMLLSLTRKRFVEDDIT